MPRPGRYPGSGASACRLLWLALSLSLTGCFAELGGAGGHGGSGYLGMGLAKVEPNYMLGASTGFAIGGVDVDERLERAILPSAYLASYLDIGLSSRYRSLRGIGRASFHMTDRPLGGTLFLGVGLNKTGSEPETAKDAVTLGLGPFLGGLRTDTGRFAIIGGVQVTISAGLSRKRSPDSW